MTEIAIDSALANEADERSADRTARLALRWLCFVAGLLINSFGVALITKAALGTSPISSVPYVLDLKFAPSFGAFTFALGLLFIAGQVVLLRRDFKPIQLLQVVANLIFSAFIDVSMALLWWLEPAGIVAETASLALGCIVLAIGITIEVAPGVILVPGEGIVRAIAHASGKPFGTCKLCFDISLMTTSCVMSLLFFGGLNGIGLGTLVSAFAVGSIVNAINAHLPLVAAIRRLGD